MAAGSIASIAVILVTYFAKTGKEYSSKAIELIKKYQQRSNFRTSLGIQADIQRELINLLKIWIPENECSSKRIILIVEDIDRCSEEKIIQNIDALRVLIEDEEVAKRVLIITAIDERILKNAIITKYKFILESAAYQKGTTNVNDPHEMISEYLDKLFIAAIKLGELSNYQVKEYMLQLFKTEAKAIKEKSDEAAKYRIFSHNNE